MIRSRHRWTGFARRAGAVLAALAFLASFTLLATSTAGAASVATTAGSRPKPPLCLASAVHVAATTNRSAYAPGQVVKLTSTITNISKTPCSAWLGLDPGFSPSFIVIAGGGKEVWDRCWSDDRPGGCFEVLYQHRLDPGRSYRTVALWDQGSGTATRPPARVHPGRYTFITDFQYIGLAKVRFTISPATT